MTVNISYDEHELKNLLEDFHIDDIQKMYEANAFDAETKLKLRPYLKQRFIRHLTNDNQTTGIRQNC